MDESGKAHSISDRCPKCGLHNLYTYWHTAASDHPELGCWYVTCHESCGYEYEDSFTDLEKLADYFTLR